MPDGVGAPVEVGAGVDMRRAAPSPEHAALTIAASAHTAAARDTALTPFLDPAHRALRHDPQRHCAVAI